MRFASIMLAGALLAAPTLALAQESNSTPPSTDCSVSGGCSSTGSGGQPNTTPDSTLKGGTSGSGTSGGTDGSGTLDNTGSGSTVDPGNSSGSGGSGSSGNGAAGPLGNTTPD